MTLLATIPRELSVSGKFLPWDSASGRLSGFLLGLDFETVSGRWCLVRPLLFVRNQRGRERACSRPFALQRQKIRIEHLRSNSTLRDAG